MIGMLSLTIAADSISLSRMQPMKEHEHKQHRHAASGHRPKASHTFYVLGEPVLNGLSAFHLPPVGGISPLSLNKTDGVLSLLLKTPLGEGDNHGAHNLYVITKKSDKHKPQINVIKETFLHHSCQWGHQYKHNPERLAPVYSEHIPLDISCHGLWDGNFHARVQSGDTLKCTVLAYGKPVSGAIVTVASAMGWIKQLQTGENGVVSFQLIRDNYPQKWSDFSRNKAEKFKIYGAYNDQGVDLSLWFSWNYYPAKYDYSSYTLGLFIALLAILIPGVSIYFYRQRQKLSEREVTFDE
jgi:hypothetical protein